MDLDSAAAIATIVGTLTTVVTTILAFLGKLRLRMPTQLSTVEARGLFALGVFVVALPIVAWGPLWGLMPTLANMMVIPGLPHYFEEEAPQDEADWTFRTYVFLIVICALGIMNLSALLSLIPDGW